MKKNPMKARMKEFLKDRKAAFTAFVMEDDFGAAVDYCRKYGVEMPADIRVFKLGMYKAAVECTDIPEYVKVSARLKIAELKRRIRER